jgi:hypothetical protein
VRLSLRKPHEVHQRHQTSQGIRVCSGDLLIHSVVVRGHLGRAQPGTFQLVNIPFQPQVRGVAQPGRAPGSGPGGRRFESSLPDHSFSYILKDLRRFRYVVIFVAFRYFRYNYRQTETKSALLGPFFSKRKVLFHLVVQIAHAVPRVAHPELTSRQTFPIARGSLRWGNPDRRREGPAGYFLFALP